jgi:hypothetical protein
MFEVKTEGEQMAGTYYAAVDGDPLTCGIGSRVIATKRTGTVEDESGQARPLAFIGDSAFCSACKSVGVIVGGAGLDGQRRLLDVREGRRQAVGGDQIACKCQVPPRIIARHGRKWMIHDRGNAIQQISHNTPLESKPVYDEKVRAVGRGATAGYPYFLETADGRTEAGRLDDSRSLVRIFTDTAEDYTAYWGDEALAKQAGA